jgi:hypothetical protein
VSREGQQDCNAGTKIRFLDSRERERDEVSLSNANTVLNLSKTPSSHVYLLQLKHFSQRL